MVPAHAVVPLQHVDALPGNVYYIAMLDKAQMLVMCGYLAYLIYAVLAQYK